MVGREKGFKGHWADHELIKPSVLTDVNEWIGWEELQKKIGKLPKERDQNIARALFETGGRVSEVIQLKPRHFQDDGEYVKVMGMPLEKSKKLTQRWPFLIEKTEPLMNSLLKWIMTRKNWLFPSPLGKNPYISRQYVWKFLHDELGLYPHWFRAQRAFCLAWEYGLTRSQIMDWFTWTHLPTAQHYARGSPYETAKKFHSY